MKNLIFMIAAMMIYSCNQNKQMSNEVVHNHNSSVEVLRTEESYIIFNDSSRFNTHLHSMKLLRSIKDNKGTPYYVLSGRINENNVENNSIFMLTLKDSVKDPNDFPSFTYPGREFNYLDQSLIFESKLFIGCFSEKNDAAESLVWVQKEVGKERTDSSIFIVTAEDGQIRESKIPSSSPWYAKVISKLKNFKELPGMDVASEP